MLMQAQTLTLGLALLLSSGHALAQAPGSHAPAQPPAATSAGSEMTEAEVRKVDKAAKKITLKHGAIKNLDMPPMTMVFQVKDAALLEQLQPGDKVRFTADQVDGAYRVLSLERVAPH